MTIAHAWAAQDASARFASFVFERRALEPTDVRIDVLFCGICHTDLHFISGDWGKPVYPCVPGHEVVGRVSAVGASVTTLKIGDYVGVGGLIDSCRRCKPCLDGLEQYCEVGATGTFMSTDPRTGLPTYGGYSDHIIVPEHFVLRIRHQERDLAGVAPLLCAGITMWSPLRLWKTGPGSTVGIVRIGGLGHMGLKLARALGSHVVAFTTSSGKAGEAKRLGAHEVIPSHDAMAMAEQADRFDLILNTVSAAQDLEIYARMLKLDGTLVLVGAGCEKNMAPDTGTLLLKRRRLAGSAIGGIAETQEMLDFCAARGITADIELVSVAEVAASYVRLRANDVRFRFVIDLETLPSAHVEKTG